MNVDKPTLPVSETDIGALVNAFRFFNETATNLNTAYQRLEARMGDLNRQLEEKDRQLYTRFRELDRVTRYLNSLVESLSAGVVAIDNEGKITIFNRTAAEMIGIQAESAIGKSYLDVLSTEGSPQGAYHTLINGPEVRGVERKFSGSGFTVISQTCWVIDSFGERIGVMELFEDVTIARGLEDRLEQQKTLSALGEMAASVAHELRNPLAGIGGYAAMLKEELAHNSNLGGMADSIVKGVQNLDKIATNLLLLTRRSTVSSSSFDIVKVLEETCDLLRSEAAMSESRTIFTLKVPHERINIIADEIMLRMMLTNLGRNAFQSIEKSGEVSFKLVWKLLVNRFDVIVTDNGCGIPKECLARLFNPFFTTREKGTGLGLALVMKAVDLHRGEITVESEVGHGSRFTISLPIMQDVASHFNETLTG